MTIVANTFLRYDAQGLRESLADIIYDVSPEETPFLSAAGRGSMKQTLEEWQTDVLAATAANAQLEGDDITSFSAIVATVRVGNYSQISRKVFLISDTEEVVDKAGRRSEMAYQIPRRGLELRRDIEAAVFLNNIGVAGNSTTPRESAGLGAHVKTNDALGAGGTSPTWTSGVPNDARNDGTQRPFTEVILKAVVELLWTTGGNLRSLFVGPFNKQAVSNFAGVVTRNFDMSNVDPSPTAVIAAIDVYVSDFGTLKVIPSRHQRERDAWFLDFEFLEVLFLRPFQTVKLAKTGDAEKRMIIAEWSLKVKNEAALGLAADLDAS